MAGSTPWMVGRNITFQITPQTVDPITGLYTAATAFTLTGTWDNAEIESDPETEEISAADGTKKHQVILKEGFKFTGTQILKRNGVNTLGAGLAGYDVFLLTTQRSGNAWWSGYVGRGNYKESGGKGAWKGTATFIEVDAGVTGPTYA